MKLKPVNLEELAMIRDGSGHSVFSPSSSSMWLECSGSLVPNLLAKDVSGPDAAYGTVAHGVTETWLKTGKRPDHLVDTLEFVESGEWGYMIEIDDKMLNYCQMCVDWVALLPGTHYFERRVDFSRITPIPRQRGTADFIAIDRRRMVVADWKFGTNHIIYAELNTQGMLYALGALYEFDKEFDGEHDIQEIEIRIAQPRLDHFDSWVISRAELLRFSYWAQQQMDLAWSLDAPRKPGVKQCQFCRVMASCAANAKLQAELTEGVFENLDTPTPVPVIKAFQDRVDDLDFGIAPVDVFTLTTSQITSMLTYRTMANRWWESLDAELARRANDGENIEQYGWKFVEGRSRRVFIDDTEAVSNIVSLGVPYDSLVTQKVASPAQCEKLLRIAGHKSRDIPSLLEGLTYKPPGRPTLAPLKDKRPALVDLTEASFENLDPVNEDEEM
jgi:hypothetical protein